MLKLLFKLLLYLTRLRPVTFSVGMYHLISDLMQKRKFRQTDAALRYAIISLSGCNEGKICNECNTKYPSK